MRSMRLPCWLWFPVEQALNRWLALDPATKQRQARLKEQPLLVQVVGVGNFYLWVDGETVRIQDHPGGSAAVVLTAPPVTLLRLLQGERSLLAQCRIVGDSRVLAHWQALFTEHTVDWQQGLLPWLPAPLVSSVEYLIQHAKQRIAQDSRWVAEETRDYVQYEARLVVPKREVEGFLQAVEAVRDDVARLEQRVAIVESLLTSPREGG